MPHDVRLNLSKTRAEWWRRACRRASVIIQENADYLGSDVIQATEVYIYDLMQDSLSTTWN